MKNKKATYYLTYLALRSLLAPFSLLSYKRLHKLGDKMEGVLFSFLSNYRKRTLSNLSLAKDLALKEENLIPTAKKSLGNLLITCLEYSKLANEKNIQNVVTCVNPEKANEIMKLGKGLIFFCGHQANWELFFLEGTSRMPGVAIGQAVKNPYLYDFVLKVREQLGGKIVLPKGAVKEGIRALRQGKFLGIVGDQGMPEAGISSPFLGRNAFTSPLPALLSYKCDTPIITATMKRKEGKYFIHYSDPIFPDKTKPSEEEVPRLMKKSLNYLESSIKEEPSQWLWQHNRWKQQLLGKVKKKYRQDAIAILLPKDGWDTVKEGIKTIKEIYPTEFLMIFTPFPLNINIEQTLYQDYNDLKKQDYRFKLVFNLTGKKCLNKHFLSLSAIKVADLDSLSTEANKKITDPLIDLLKGAILHAR
jgi:Kdo2-lipid IVA lauroyltransferase/acyltransferase